MFRLETDRALIQAFRPRDRRVIEMPKGVSFPHFVRDYLAWTETSGARVYLVFAATGSVKPIGIIFRRDSLGGERMASMCEWCHTYGGSSEVGLLTTDVNSKRRVGVSLCADLRCKDRLEDAANRSGRHPGEILAELRARMSRFAQEVLDFKVEQASPVELSDDRN
ncbi:FBP domain-containing protein [Myxococcaceae bacterium JPH2]|nr:FBP domain-containing protein [Myxococcaceae bacterium JPH2]